MKKNIHEVRSNSRRKIGGRRKQFTSDLSRFIVNFIKENWDNGDLFKKAYQNSSSDNYGTFLNAMMPITKEGAHIELDSHSIESTPKNMDVLLHIIFVNFKDYNMRGVISPWGQFYEPKTSPTGHAAIVVSLFIDKQLYNKKFPLENLNHLIPEMKSTIHHEMVHFYQYLYARQAGEQNSLIEYYTDPIEVEAYVRGIMKYAKMKKANPKNVFKSEYAFIKDQIIANGNLESTAKIQMKYIKKVWEEEIKKVYPEEYKKYFKRGLFSLF